MQQEAVDVSATPESFLPELLYEVAFRGSPLASSTLCPADRIHTLTEKYARQQRATMWGAPPNPLLLLLPRQ